MSSKYKIGPLAQVFGFNRSPNWRKDVGLVSELAILVPN